MIIKLSNEAHPEGLSILEATHYGPMEPLSGYPKGFLDFLYPLMGITDPDKVVHLCSGTLQRGITVDLRESVNPTILADCRSTGIEANSVPWVVSDPPPGPIYNEIVYGLPAGKNYPKPEEIVEEAARILAPGGKLAILCLWQPLRDSGLKLISTHALLLGECVIRGLFLYEKPMPTYHPLSWPVESHVS